MKEEKLSHVKKSSGRASSKRVLVEQAPGKPNAFILERADERLGNENDEVALQISIAHEITQRYQDALKKLDD